MKFNVTFKTPDVMESVLSDVQGNAGDVGILEDVREDIMEFVSKYIRNEEYITIEFDMTAKTATVLPRS